MMMSIFRSVPLALVLLACLVGCDTSAPPAAVPAELSKAIPFDADVIARAAALDDSRPQAPLSARYSSVDRPLYAFASQTEYERAADALARLARFGGKPLDIHERFRSLDLNDFFAPGPEIALLDENGQVVIGDNRVTLQIRAGEPLGEVADAATGVSRETIRSTLRSLDEVRAEIGTRMSGNVQARISENAEDEYGVFPSIAGDKTVAAASGFNVGDVYGRAWDMWFVYAHSAYVTYTGAKRVKAATEAVIAGSGISFQNAITAQRSYFPNLRLSASVLTEDHGCRTYSDFSGYGTSSSGYLEIEVGGSRGQGQAVIESTHRQVDTGSGFVFGFDKRLDGANNSWAKCGRLP